MGYRVFIISVLMGLLLSVGIGYAYRMPRPVRITEFNEENLAVLNEALENLWNVSNGRYNLNLVTVNPDGATRGDIGDMVLLSTGGNYYLEINVDGGTTWRGAQITNTP